MAHRSFLDLLKDMRGGQTVDELGEHVQGLVEAVRETGRKGSLTYTVVIAPASKGDVNTLLLEDNISVKTPKTARAATVFFATNENILQRNDPRQPELAGLRVLDYPAPVKEGSGE